MSKQAATQENTAAGLVPPAPWRIHTLAILPGWRLSVTFNDGRTGVVDCSLVVRQPQAGIFAALADESFFRQAALVLGAVSWPNGADLDPHWMHEELGRESTWVVPF